MKNNAILSCTEHGKRGEKRARIGERKFRKILKYFTADLTAKQVSELTGLNRNTINGYFKIFREMIASYQEKTTKFDGEIELDESYFGGKKKGDKRGRGVTNKVPVFGILKREGKVFTQIIKNASSAEIKPIVKKCVAENSIIYTDKWKAYDGLVLDRYKHYRINHSQTFGEKSNHINGIENFWGWSKARLAKLKGIKRSGFYWHLKRV